MSPMAVSMSGIPYWSEPKPRKNRARPTRQDCPKCGRKGVAQMRDGTLWWHKLPGWGLWSDGGDCKA